MVIELLKVIVLGIIEGVTEFLPISSTGHLIVATAILQPNFSEALEGTFEIFIQLGAVIAVIAFYRADLLRQARSVTRDRSVQRFWLAIIVACIPAALIGFLLRGWIKDVLFSPVVVAISLIIGGVLFLVLERRFAQGEQPSTQTLEAITLWQALIVGVAQTIALIPGVSRAAASIFGGMFTGMDRPTATRFSFYLAIPTLGGATVTDLLLSLDEISGDDLLYLVVGCVVAGVVAWVSIGWLLRYIATNTFIPFGYYRIAAGAIILVLSLAGILV